MVEIALQNKLIPKRSNAAIDATGLETRHVSRYFQWRKGVRVAAVTYPKLTAVCDLESHLVLAAEVSLGPSVDQPQFKAAITNAVAVQPIARLLGDKGYDAEPNHILCRELLGIDATIIPARRSPQGGRWPLSRYRRQMRPRKNREGYGQRWQIESLFSRHKRLLGAALRARSWATQQWEILARVLTHNIMLVAAC